MLSCASLTCMSKHQDASSQKFPLLWRMQGNLGLVRYLIVRRTFYSLNILDCTSRFISLSSNKWRQRMIATSDVLNGQPFKASRPIRRIRHSPAVKSSLPEERKYALDQAVSHIIVLRGISFFMYWIHDEINLQGCKSNRGYHPDSVEQLTWHEGNSDTTPVSLDGGLLANTRIGRGGFQRISNL